MQALVRRRCLLIAFPPAAAAILMAAAFVAMVGGVTDSVVVGQLGRSGLQRTTLWGHASAHAGTGVAISGLVWMLLHYVAKAAGPALVVRALTFLSWFTVAVLTYRQGIEISANIGLAAEHTSPWLSVLDWTVGVAAGTGATVAIRLDVA
ncbi:hypothetical protein WEH80_06000 [Actinomycetes bacterium KLBMP 9759]